MARLDAILRHFPRSHYRCPSVIKQLSCFASNGQVAILKSLASRSKRK
jgi:hypothetical protein